MKRLFLIVSIFCCSLGFAQNKEQMAGKWVFKDLHNADGMDEASKEIAVSQLKGQLYFLLKESEQYEANIMGEEFRGEWMLANKVLQLVTDKKTVEFTILKFSGSEMVLQVGEGSFLMKKEKLD